MTSPMEIADTFMKFSKLIPSDGYLVGYGDDVRVKDIISKSQLSLSQVLQGHPYNLF